MKMILCRILGAAGVMCVLGCASTHVPQYEATRTEKVTDTYHGVTVADPFRWLEDWSNPDVKAWSERQNVLARSYLDALPSRAAVKARLEVLEGGGTVRYGSMKYSRGMGLYLAMKHQPPKQQDFLVGLSSTAADRKERVLVDPNTMDPSGSTTIDWYETSPDGTLVAVSMSKGGSESGDIHVIDAATGGVKEIVTRGHGGTAGGSLAWAPDSKSFLYTRYPHAGERAAARSRSSPGRFPAVAEPQPSRRHAASTIFPPRRRASRRGRSR
jgi:prolyl oligopeptidase